MTHPEFQMEMVRLVETYGKTAYSNERVRLIFRAVEPFTSEWWRSSVDYLIGHCRQAPLMPELVELIQRERGKNRSQQERGFASTHSTSWSCGDCKDGGVFLAKNKSLSGVYAFRCACSVGLSDSRNAIPYYKQDHADAGFYFYEVRS